MVWESKEKVRAGERLAVKEIIGLVGYANR